MTKKQQFMKKQFDQRSNSAHKILETSSLKDVFYEFSPDDHADLLNILDYCSGLTESNVLTEQYLLLSESPNYKIALSECSVLLVHISEMLNLLSRYQADFLILKHGSLNGLRCAINYTPILTYLANELSNFQTHEIYEQLRKKAPKG